MGRDFRIGLICGLVLVVVALLWVATRPSLNSQARMLGPTRSVSRGAPSSSRTDSRAQPRRTLPPGLVPAESDTAPVPGRTAAEPAPDSAPSTPSAATRPDMPDLTIYEQPEKIKTTKFHIVRQGESLSSIAQQYYGVASQWQKILRANRDTIKDANKITPGTKLIIPD